MILRHKEKDMSKSIGLADDFPTSVERTGDDWLESIELVDDTTIFLQNAYEVKKLYSFMHSFSWLD